MYKLGSNSLGMVLAVSGMMMSATQLVSLAVQFSIDWNSLLYLAVTFSSSWYSCLASTESVQALVTVSMRSSSAAFSSSAELCTGLESVLCSTRMRPRQCSSQLRSLFHEKTRNSSQALDDCRVPSVKGRRVMLTSESEPSWMTRGRLMDTSLREKRSNA